MTRASASLTGLTLLAVMLALAPSTLSLASLTPLVARAVSVSTLKWAVVPLAQAGVVGSGPYTLSWEVSGGNAYDYFDLVNLGSVDVNQFVMTVTNVPTGSSQNLPLVTLDVCVGGSWNTTANTCSGSIQTLGQGTASGMTVTMASLPLGSRSAIRATTRPNTRNNAVTTVAVSVSRADIRAGQVAAG